MTGKIKSFIKNTSGNFAVIFGVGVVPLFAVAALTIDYTVIFQKRSELQQIADLTALASARELAISSTDKDDLQSIADAYVAANMVISKSESVTVDVVPGADNKSVNVSLSYVWTPFFAHMFDSSALPIIANSTASLASTSNRASICVLALNQKDAATLQIGKKSSMTANGCAVFANSTSSSAISVNANAALTATDIFTSGGYDSSSKAYKPTPTTDAPPTADPLRDRAAPKAGGCDRMNYATITDATIFPGTYCGGIDIGDAAIVKMEPGEYVMLDGPLMLRGNSTLLGENVGFYFKGDASVFDFGVSTQVNISAPKSGNLAGILFFEDRGSTKGRTFTIRSKDAERFEGTIYLPNARLFIDKASKVGQTSKWTAIVADKIDIGMGPQVQINSDYANSSVPVPGEISGTDNVRLIK